MAHIPDGFLSAPVTAGTLVAAGALVAHSASRSRRELDERAAPTLGLATAAVFAAQMINFPVAAGTSGHLMGGTLIAVMFGPWSAFLVMTAVLIAQALIFADGGITALGANILNIAGGGALFGYVVYWMMTALIGAGAARRGLAAAAAAFLGMVVTGIAAGFELGLSGVAPTRLAVGAMASVHAIIGLVEGLITGLLVATLARKRPDILYRVRDASPVGAPRPVVLASLGVMAVLVGALSVIASTAPDSLERVAIDLGFADAASTTPWAPLANYRAWVPGPAGVLIAGIVGIALLFAGVMAMVRALTLSRASREG
jgi:cobalt/nickel transport system permease protein